MRRRKTGSECSAGVSAVVKRRTVVEVWSFHAHKQDVFRASDELDQAGAPVGVLFGDSGECFGKGLACGEVVQEDEPEPVVEVFVFSVGVPPVEGEVLRTKPVFEFRADEVGPAADIVIPARLPVGGTYPVKREGEVLQLRLAEGLRAAAGGAEAENEIVFLLHGRIIP